MWCERWQELDPTTHRPRQCEGHPGKHLTPVHPACAGFEVAEEFRCGPFSRSTYLAQCATFHSAAVQGGAQDVKVCSACESGKRARFHAR